MIQKDPSSNQISLTKKAQPIPSEQQNIPSQLKNALLLWQAKEYEKIPKSQNWYIITFLVFFALIAYALFTDNLLMAILFILFGVAIYLFDKKEANVYTFGILPEGIYAQNQIYEFHDLKSFWIFYTPGEKKILSIKSKKSFLPYTHIPLGSVNPVEVREKLLDFIPEERQEESFFDIIDRFF